MQETSLETKILIDCEFMHKIKMLDINLPQFKCVQTMLLNRLIYISHPSTSYIECAINLYKWPISDMLLTEQTNVKTLFYNIAQEILEMSNCNPKQVNIKYETYSILFKDVAAMKFLNIIFKGNENHALYKIYLKWLEGSEWMSNC